MPPVIYGLFEKGEKGVSTFELLIELNKLKFIKMKNLIIKTWIPILVICFLFNVKSKAQSVPSVAPSIAVLDFDCKSVDGCGTYLASITRTEISEWNSYNLLINYDVDYLAEKAGINAKDCHTTNCIIEYGKAANSDFVLSANLENYNDYIIYSMRLTDVNGAKVASYKTKKFIDNLDNLEQMTLQMVRLVFDRQTDDHEISVLEKGETYYVDIPKRSTGQLALAGPRIGVAYFESLQVARDAGRGVNPLTTIIGYQFEKMYLNRGDYQMLFEMIPMIVGLEQGMFIPSFSLLHGVRNNKTGLEIGVGPNVSLSFAGYQAGLVFAAGINMRAGDLNFPLNAYIAPRGNKQSSFGISTGYTFRQ